MKNFGLPKPQRSFTGSSGGTLLLIVITVVIISLIMAALAIPVNSKVSLGGGDVGTTPSNNTRERS